MYFFGVGTGYDIAVTDFVNMIRAATNVLLHETHHSHRLEVEDIIQSMSARSSSLLVSFCHGSATALIDVARLPFISGSDHRLFAEKIVFAHACNSALHLGRDMVRSAFIYLGFDAPVSAPVGPSSPCYGGAKNLYSKLLSFLSLVDVSDLADLPVKCQTFLNDLSADAIHLQAVFDTEDGSQLDTEELISINQFSKDVVIWAQSWECSFKAEGAPDRFSLW